MTVRMKGNHGILWCAENPRTAAGVIADLKQERDILINAVALLHLEIRLIKEAVCVKT